MAALHADSYMTIKPVSHSVWGTTTSPTLGEYDTYTVTFSDLVTRTEVWKGMINGNPMDGTYFASEIAFLLRRNNVVKDCPPGSADSAITHAMIEIKDGHLKSFR